MLKKTKKYLVYTWHTELKENERDSMKLKAKDSVLKHERKLYEDV